MNVKRSLPSTNVNHSSVVIFWFVLALILSGCNSGSSSSDTNNSGIQDNADNTPADNSGGNNDDAGNTPTRQILTHTAQKGPFSVGSLVTLTRIDENGNATSDEMTTVTEADGSFDSPELGWDGPTMVTVTGPYFDETEGTFTTEELTLRAFPKAIDGEVDTNVNLLTHILARYIEFWMADGFEYDELRDTYGIPFVNSYFGTSAAPGELNLLDNLGTETVDASSRSLLLLSAAFLKAGLDQQALDKIADDFAESDGSISGDGVQDFRLWMTALFDDPSALFSQARTALNNQYNRTDEIPELNARFVFGNQCEVLGSVLCGESTAVNDLNIPADGLTVPIWPQLTGSYNIWLGFDTDLSWRVLEADTENQVFPVNDGAFWRRFLARGNVAFVKLVGGKRYLLDIRNGSVEAKTGEESNMEILSYGRAADPIWIKADNQPIRHTAGISILPGSRGDSTTSYYRIQGTAGGYRLNFKGLSCNFTGNLGFNVRVHQWDEANTTSANSTTNGFVSGTVKASTTQADRDLCEVNYDFAITRGNSGFISVKNNRNGGFTEYAPGSDRYEMTLKLTNKL